jgi:hypothetical protein
LRAVRTRQHRPPSCHDDAPDLSADADRAVLRTRARAETDERVIEVAGLMSAGKWRAPTSHALLAEKYGVTPAAVEKWATSASRLLRMMDSAQLAAYRARNIERLDELYDLALDAEHVDSQGGVHPQPDIRGATGAVAEQNKLLGLIIEKHEVTGNVQTGDFEALRAALVTELCDGCRERVLARVRAKEAGQ